MKKRYNGRSNIIPAAPALPQPNSPQLLIPIVPRYKRDIDGNILDDEQLDANIWGLSSQYLQILNGHDQNRVLSDFEDDQEWIQEGLGAARAEDDEEEEVIDCATKKSIYVNQYSSDVEDFIAKFVKEEHQEEKTRGDVDLEGIAKRIWPLVMTFESEILEALLRVDLPVLYRTDQKVRAAIDKIQARAKALPYQPRIYGNFLVKLATGQSPSPEILSQVADLAIGKYLEDNQYAARVDSAIGSSVAWEDTQRGARKYLDPQRTAAVCNLSRLARVAKLGVLCRALDRRCEKVSKANGRTRYQDPAANLATAAMQYNHLVADTSLGDEWAHSGSTFSRIHAPAVQRDQLLLRRAKHLDEKEKALSKETVTTGNAIIETSRDILDSIRRRDHGDIEDLLREAATSIHEIMDWQESATITSQRGQIEGLQSSNAATKQELEKLKKEREKAMTTRQGQEEVIRDLTASQTSMQREKHEYTLYYIAGAARARRKELLFKKKVCKFLAEQAVAEVRGWRARVIQNAKIKNN